MAEPSINQSASGKEVRLACRSGQYSSTTSGLIANHIQANLIVLPSRYANDFRLLCQRNPIPCPLLAESHQTGDFQALKSWISNVPDSAMAADLDLRYDCPRYMVYQNGVVTKSSISDTAKDWTCDHVAFLIGCSFSFETALANQGLTPAHVKHGRNVPMYRTSIPLHPSGVFQDGTFVVSMRLYQAKDLEQVRAITRPFVATHGEPIAWGWDGLERIGIEDVHRPEWGDAPICEDGRLLEDIGTHDKSTLLPIFWGCGVTPQAAVMQVALPGTVIAHAPGHMLLLDIKDKDILTQ